MTATAPRYRWCMFWILAAGYLLVYFHRLCPAVVAKDMGEDLGAGETLVGLLGSAYFWPYALMQIPAGLLADSWGPRRTITVFLVIAAAGSALMGCSGAIGAAIAGRTLVGFGVAVLFVPTLKILTRWFRTGEFAAVTGIFVAMGGVGTLSATAPLALLVSWQGWRFSFLAVGALTLLVGALVWWVVRDRPEDLGLPPVAGPDPPDSDSGVMRLPARVSAVLSCSRFWPLAAWFFFLCAVFFTYSGLWGGSYLREVYGLSRERAGAILAMIAAGMIVGSPLLGYLSERVLGARKPLLIAASAVVVLVTALLAFCTDRIPLQAHYALCFGLGMCGNAIVVIGFTAAKEIFPVEIAGTAIGLINFFPFAGGAVFQMVLGYVLEASRKADDLTATVAAYRAAFLILFACSVAALAASLLVKETFRAR